MRTRSGFPHHVTITGSRRIVARRSALCGSPTTSATRAEESQYFNRALRARPR